MRKGRFELWLGLLCVVMVLGATLAAHKRNWLHARWLEYRFRTCSKEDCKYYLAGIADLDGIPGRLWASPSQLEVVSRRPGEITVRNNRRSRVHVEDPWAGQVKCELECYSYDEIRADSGPVIPKHRVYCLPGPVLDPGESVRMTVRRRGEVLRGDAISDIPLGNTAPPTDHCPIPSSSPSSSPPSSSSSSS